ncbi:hypothetical protein FA13DRAFT_343492 [Coprinellus micaceus]|uniref:Uncharacterized protein n=1 Tax=Coprinellus micaceus TaxID=71717 RepID=A0A4Y7SCY7_COPMI|nr:hypothetical protein FA13DRAFT_343492 [Coprinellus micaceus]
MMASFGSLYTPARPNNWPTAVMNGPPLRLKTWQRRRANLRSCREDGCPVSCALRKDGELSSFTSFRAFSTRIFTSFVRASQGLPARLTGRDLSSVFAITRWPTRIGLGFTFTFFGHAAAILEFPSCPSPCYETQHCGLSSCFVKATGYRNYKLLDPKTPLHDMPLFPKRHPTCSGRS